MIEDARTITFLRDELRRVHRDNRALRKDLSAAQVALRHAEMRLREKGE
jgi:hypothetical protein